MNKAEIFLMCWCLVVPAFLWAADDGFTVAGEIQFTKTGPLYLSLATKAEFEGNNEQEAPSLFSGNYSAMKKIFS